MARNSFSHDTYFALAFPPLQTGFPGALLLGNGQLVQPTYSSWLSFFLLLLASKFVHKWNFHTLNNISSHLKAHTHVIFCPSSELLQEEHTCSQYDGCSRVSLTECRFHFFVRYSFFRLLFSQRTFLSHSRFVRSLICPSSPSSCPTSSHSHGLILFLFPSFPSTSLALIYLSFSHLAI